LQFDGVERDYAYAGFPAASRNVQSNTGLDTITIGVNYLFNWGPAQTAHLY